MYTITIHYKDGDSFKTWESDTTLDGQWELDVAKENLKRIKEHYTAYDKRNNYVSMGKNENPLLEELKKERWFSPKVESWDSWEYSLVLLENDGTTKKYSTRWCGYFERLISAKVVAIVPEENDMEFEWGY